MSILYVVATPIGNLGDISARALEILTNCDLILAEDTRHSLKLLNHYNIKNKLQAYHKFNEKEKSDSIINLMLKKDIKVCLISDAGTPCISDPGYEIVKLAKDQGVEVIAIPGPSAIISGLSISGFDLSSFSFYGFLDRENTAINKKLNEIKNSTVPVSVLYESPKRLVKTISRINELMPNANVCICSDLTKIHERTIYGNVGDVYKYILSDPNIEKGEYVIIIENKTADQINKEENKFSIEALIIDEIVKNNCSIKEAIKNVSNNANIPKNKAYEASLNIKKLLNI